MALYSPPQVSYQRISWLERDSLVLRQCLSQPWLLCLISLSRRIELCPVRALRYYLDKTKDILQGKELVFSYLLKRISVRILLLQLPLPGSNRCFCVINFRMIVHSSCIRLRPSKVDYVWTRFFQPVIVISVHESALHQLTLSFEFQSTSECSVTFTTKLL